jgi:tRNA(Phe) wybutosine-synthesizing methylase Tyw3
LKDKIENNGKFTKKKARKSEGKKSIKTKFEKLKNKNSRLKDAIEKNKKKVTKTSRIKINKSKE